MQCQFGLAGWLCCDSTAIDSNPIVDAADSYCWASFDIEVVVDAAGSIAAAFDAAADEEDSHMDAARDSTWWREDF